MDSGGGIASPGNLVLSNVTITGNSAFHFGGGVFCAGNLTILNSTIRSNVTSDVAGGVCFTGGTLSISNSSISYNSSGDGGGVAILNGNASIFSSAIDNNVSNPYGGGGGVRNKGDLTLVNCTISGNRTREKGGGGIKNLGNLYTINCTIAFNRETHSSLGGGVHNLSNFFAFNTVIVSNLVADPASVDAAPDFGGRLISQGHNLIGNPTNASIEGDPTGNLYFVDPRLGILQDNGGLTRTHALLPDSPALNSGDNTGSPLTDQRGVVRPQGPAVDIGAFESIVATTNVGPQLIGLTLSNGVFSFVLNGAIGTNFLIESSSNLVNWAAISTNLIPIEGRINLADPTATSQPHRFYRAIPQ